MSTFWLCLLSFLAGGFVGTLAMALLVAASRDDDENLLP